MGSCVLLQRRSQRPGLPQDHQPCNPGLIKAVLLLLGSCFCFWIFLPCIEEWSNSRSYFRIGILSNYQFQTEQINSPSDYSRQLEEECHARARALDLDPELYSRQTNYCIQQIPVAGCQQGSNNSACAKRTNSVETLRLTKERLSERADKDGIVTITLASSSFLKFVLNWQYSLEKAGVSNFFIVAVDLQTLNDLLYDGAPLLLSEKLIDADSSEWGDTSFTNVQYLKQPLVKQILELGFDVLFSDADQYWFKDPFPYFASTPEAHILSSTDCALEPSCSDCQDGKHRDFSTSSQLLTGLKGVENTKSDISTYELNIGLILFRRSPEVIEFLEDWIATLQRTKQWDQLVFNEMLLRGDNNTATKIEGVNGTLYAMYHGRLKVGILPATYFANGLAYWLQGLVNYKEEYRPYMIHANYQYDSVVKEWWFRQAGTWRDRSDYYAHSQGYLTYTPTLPQELVRGALEQPSGEAMMQLKKSQLEQLQNAFGVAQSLGRILILPDLWGWALPLAPRLQDGASGSELQKVSLDEVLKLGEIADNRPGWVVETPPIRESGFLQHPAASPLWDSVVRVLVCADCSSSNSTTSTFRKKTNSTHTITIGAALPSHMIKHVLQEVAHVKVIEYESMEGAFGGYSKFVGKRQKWCLSSFVSDENFAHMSCS